MSILTRERVYYIT
ncbi:hypothetical protein R3I93_004598 [Phoxinus phoxinus]|uniref:Uncharacterized protein n=1 Tax=Phoxinus phoxinus TaxID=58324 RepID=A0AAN9HBR5_9TELE